jgi:hypothetical protein
MGASLLFLLIYQSFSVVDNPSMRGFGMRLWNESANHVAESGLRLLHEVGAPCAMLLVRGGVTPFLTRISHAIVDTIACTRMRVFRAIF